MPVLSNLEWPLFLIALWVALAATIVLRRRLRFGVMAVLLGLLTTAIGSVWSDAHEEQSKLETAIRVALPKAGDREGYVSSDACRVCHPAQHASWRRTYHRTMTQVASPQSVQAPFEGTLNYQGETYQLSRRGSEYWVNMPNLESSQPGRPAPRIDRRVGLVTGSHHMQAFWLSNGPGNLQISFPFTYVSETRRWVPRSDVFLSRFELGPQVWNYNCILCHSTGPEPRPQGRGESADSRVAELGISCEACHGPGAEHVRANSNPVRRLPLRWTGAADTTIVNPARLSPVRSAQVCGQCHGLWSFVQSDADVALHGPAYRPGQDLEDTMRLMRPRQIASQPFLQDQLKATPDYIRERYWPDGIVRISGRDYSGLVESACFRSGMLSCLSCHSMHDSDPQNQLKPQMMGNEACLQCHTSYRDAVEEHTHHPAGSEGSTCYNCHMPRTVYGLMKSIRSHYIDSPNAAVAGAGARPNACNLCHLDKTLGWTASHLSEWYGSPTPVLSADDESTASSLLQLLRGDAGQRALVASHMGWAPAREASGSTWFAPFLAQLLNDEYSAVRYIAGRSLRELPGFEDVDYDYLGSRAARDEARRRVLDSWRATQVGPRRVVGRELLIDSSGGLMVDAIAPLIGERDPRPLYLAE